MAWPVVAACAAMSVPHADAAMTGPRVADLYLECLADFERYAESVWHGADDPPGSGYFGDGASQGNGGIRGTCGICVAYATLNRAGRGDEEARGRRLERLEAALRYAAETHLTGHAKCVDGKQWGGGWQTALWAGSLGFSAALVEDQLDAEVVAACRQVVAYEAHRLAQIPPPTGYRGDSKAEENAWNSNVLALAAAWLSDDPRAADWTAAAKRYLANTYTVPDAADDPLADWITTTTLYPSFACENHGFFHPSYQAVSGMSLGDSLEMARALNSQVAAQLRPFAEHNVLPAWACLSKVLLDSGELAYPSGLDWSLHGYGQIPYYAWLATHFGDPTARWAEGSMARHLAFRQRLSGDGRFTGESVPDGFYREAVMARRVALAWWHHRLAQHADGPRKAPEPFVDHLADVGLVLQRSRQGFISLSYGARTMALVVPESRSHPAQPYVVTPRYPSLIGAGPLGPPSKTALRGLALMDDGFEAEVELEYGPLASALVRLVSFGDAVAIIEVPMRAVELSGTGLAAFPVGIENHALTGGSRRLVWAAGQRTVEALSGEDVEVEGNWVNVSGRYGFIAGPAGSLRYRAADRYNRRGAAEDDLHYAPEDADAPRYAVVLPGASAEATRRAADGIGWEVEEGSVRLSFEAPSSGQHTVRVALRQAPARRAGIPIAEVRASSASERHPGSLAADGDPQTFWCSSRGGAPGDGPTPEQPEWLQFVLDRAALVEEIIVLPRPRYGPKEVVVALDDVSVFEGRMAHDPLQIRLPEPRRASRARLTITSSYDPSYPEAPRNVQVVEVVFLQAEE